MLNIHLESSGQALDHAVLITLDEMRRSKLHFLDFFLCLDSEFFAKCMAFTAGG